MRTHRFHRYFTLLLLLCQILPFRALAEESAYAEKKIQAAGEQAKANADLYYDEAFDREGNLREAYREIYPQYAGMTKAQIEALRKQSVKDFKGDNALAPIARILKESEYAEVKKGVEQRGRAIQLFLEDYYGEQRFLKDGLMPREVLDRIAERTGELGFRGRINPKEIAFPYGPDLMRGLDPSDPSKTRWYVFEDNIGYLGGLGDLIHGQETLLKNVPGYAAQVKGSADPEQFYKNQLSRYRSQLKDPKDKIILYSLPPYPDNEDARLKKIWRDLGVEIVTPNTKKKLKVEKDGVYLVSRDAIGRQRKERVGYMILNAEHHSLDYRHPVAKEKFLRFHAGEALEDKGIAAKDRRAIKKALNAEPFDLAKLEAAVNKAYDMTGAKRGMLSGLLNAIEDGRLKSNYSPGIDIVSDKEFYTYVEDFIRYYLKEEPVLRNIPTERLYIVDKSGKLAPNPKAFEKLEKDFANHVLKVVDGRGGSNIWVGPKISPAEQREAHAFAKENFARMQVQLYRHPSVLAGDIVDLRVYSQFAPASAVEKGIPYAETTPIPWSRGLSMDGNGKMNVSGDGHEVSVFVVKDKVERDLSRADCRRLYRLVSP